MSPVGDPAVVRKYYETLIELAESSEMAIVKIANTTRADDWSRTSTGLCIVLLLVPIIGIWWGNVPKHVGKIQARPEVS